MLMGRIGGRTRVPASIVRDDDLQEPAGTLPSQVVPLLASAPSGDVMIRSFDRSKDLIAVRAQLRMSRAMGRRAGDMCPPLLGQVDRATRGSRAVARIATVLSYGLGGRNPPIAPW